MKQYYIIISIVILFIFLIVFFYRGLKNQLILTKYVFKSPKIDRDIHVSFLSDLHSCIHGEENKDILDKLDQIKPDLIILVGDIVDDKLPEEPTFELLKKLAKIAPSFYVTGNHENYNFEVDRIKDDVAKTGVQVLSGNKKQVNIKGNTINILGLDDPFCREDLFQEQLEGLMAQRNPEFTIFLGHRPDRIKEYLKVESDLIFSGHAHGGQVKIPYLVEALYSPNQGLFPKYTSGFYKFENHTMLVGRGMSRESTKLPRFYNPPELIHLVITSDQ